MGLFLSMMWALWMYRNKVVVGGEEPVVDIIVEGFLRLLRDYRLYTKEVHAPSPLPSTFSFEKWQPPPSGWIKINTDAAIIKGVGTGLGWVARDCEGKVLVAGV
uniref:RNase H type-1 domain-containing protein n=1 Tax=Opuntia streptacantha TaxID=393608 RepID=A0A7C9EA03_OPUST